MSRKLYFFTLLLVAITCCKTKPNVRFTKIECFADDKCIDFEYCHLKAINRSYRYVSLKTKIVKFPIDEIKVNLAVLKRANGWRPFLYNFTTDACKFLRERKNPLHQFFFSFLLKHTNLNQNCPFYHDFYVEKLSDSHVTNLLEKLPVPNGDYAIWTSWYAQNMLKARIYAYGSYTS